MTTHAVIEIDRNPIFAVYHDGYPEGIGCDLWNATHGIPSMNAIQGIARKWNATLNDSEMRRPLSEILAGMNWEFNFSAGKLWFRAPPGTIEVVLPGGHPTHNRHEWKPITATMCR